MLKFFTNINKLLNILIAFCLASMSLLILGNVILRYVFNTGIVWAEEMSRFMFVWMIFLGAIVALKEHNHISVDIITRKLPFFVKRIVFVISNLIVLFTLWIVLKGSWQMTIVNASNLAPVTKLSYSYIYGIGIVAGIGMGLIVLVNIYKALFHGELNEAEESTTDTDVKAEPTTSTKVSM